MRFSPSKLTLASVFIASTAINSVAILPVHAQTAPSIVVASTTSTEQSGLFAHMLPEFKKAAGKPIIYNGNKYYVCEPTPQSTDLKIGELAPSLANVAYDIAYVYTPKRR